MGTNETLLRSIAKTCVVRLPVLLVPLHPPVDGGDDDGGDKRPEEQREERLVAADCRADERGGLEQRRDGRHGGKEAVLVRRRVGAVRAQQRRQRRQRLKEEREGADVEGRRVAADGLCPDAEADDVAERRLEAMSAGR